MTRTNHNPDSPARELISMPSRRAAALLVSSGMVLLTLTLLAAPLGAAHRAGVAPAAAHPGQQADAGPSGTPEVQSSGREGLAATPPKDTRAATCAVPIFCPALGQGDHSRDRWVKLNQLLTGLGAGFLIAAVRLMMKFGGGRGLSRNLFAWIYVWLAGALTGISYMMAFTWFKSDTEGIKTFFGATEGAGPILGNAMLLLVGRWLGRPSAAAEAEAASLKESLDKSTDLLMEIIGRTLEESPQKKATDMAERYKDPALIKRTVQLLADAAVYSGRLAPEIRYDVIKDVSELEFGSDERTNLNSRRAAIARAAQAIPIDSLESHLAMGDWDGKEQRLGVERRNGGNGWDGVERRWGSDRRLAVTAS